MTPSAGRYLSEPDDLPIVALMRRTSIYLAGVEKDLAGDAALNVTAARALVLIVEADVGVEAFSPKALAEVLDLSTASMTALTDRLEDAGLVERRPNIADRRKICLHPTTARTAEHERIQRELDAAIDGRLAALTGREREAFRKGLLALASL